MNVAGSSGPQRLSGGACAERPQGNSLGRDGMHGRGLPEESRKAEAVDDEVMTIAATAATSRIVAQLVPERNCDHWRPAPARPLGCDGRLITE